MSDKKVYTVIGLMSGTSLDGVDAALIRTDGVDYTEYIDSLTIPYEQELKDSIRSCFGKTEDIDGYIARVEQEITKIHASAVDWILSKTSKDPQDIDVLGFHGQTIFHDPDNKFTWQIGNGAMLARITGINVINNFRTNDVVKGGQGAPLLPLYHRAKARNESKPLAILNIGGVSNVTWLGSKEEDILAFDTGPGNALIDDFVFKALERPYDECGLIARQGQVDDESLQRFLSHEYFNLPAPKSLDRCDFDVSNINHLKLEDALATLTMFTVYAIKHSFDLLPTNPKQLMVTGGGRHNTYMMECLERELSVPVISVDKKGWNGDSLEAEGFAYLAVRSLLGLPISLPSTTGVNVPQTGGDLYKAGLL